MNKSIHDVMEELKTKRAEMFAQNDKIYDTIEEYERDMTTPEREFMSMWHNAVLLSYYSPMLRRCNSAYNNRLQEIESKANKTWITSGAYRKMNLNKYLRTTDYEKWVAEG